MRQVFRVRGLSANVAQSPPAALFGFQRKLALRPTASALQDASKLQNAALANSDANDCLRVADAYRIAKRLLAAAVASMSYETAQKVRQQQVRDRLAYALIIFLGFVALYINIKRTVKEAAEWEKEHN